MNAALSEDELAAIYRAFQATDLDSDGYIRYSPGSKKDLQLSTGIVNEAEIDAIYHALRHKQSHVEDAGVSLEEFEKGIMDFPFLLEQVKEGFGSNIQVAYATDDCLSEADFIEERSSSEEDSPRFHDVNPSGPVNMHILYIIRSLYSELDTREPPPPDTDSAIDLLGDIRSTVISLADKAESNPSLLQSTEAQTTLFHATLWMVDLFLEAIEGYNKLVLEHTRREDDLTLANIDLSRNCQILQASNCRLFERLQALEDDYKAGMQSEEEVHQKTSVLKEQLRKAVESEEQAAQEISAIQTNIQLKETQIKELQREIRRLASRKALQELPLSLPSKRRNQCSSLRTSEVPIEFTLSRGLSPIHSPSVNSTRTSAIRPPDPQHMRVIGSMVSILQKQQAEKAVKLRDKEGKLEEWEYQLRCRESDLESYVKQKVEVLTEDVEMLVKRLKEEQLKTLQLKLSLDENSLTSNLTTEELCKDYEHLGDFFANTSQRPTLNPAVKSYVCASKPAREGCCGLLGL